MYFYKFVLFKKSVVRSLICVWMVFGHCGFFSAYAYDNLPVLMANAERIEMQPLLAVLFYVDVFFVLR